jgi:hypothetical protein
MPDVKGGREEAGLRRYRQADFGGQRIDRYDEGGPDSGRKGLSLLSSKVERRPQGKGNLVKLENKKEEIQKV